ncbi:MAG: DUF4962 domain-containing protein, partial [Ruminococcaceae bacterium]|nr:DUF4962 domain-containing protein [Oscillospiraceae bacterium]
MLSQAVVMYLNKSNVLLHGNKTYISENRTIVPFQKDGATYLPAAFFAESIGGVFSESDGKAIVTLDGKTHCLEAVCGPGHVWYAEMTYLCNTFHKHLHAEANGIIVYSDENLEDTLSWTTNKEFMRQMVLSFIYDEVVGSEMTRLVKAKHPNHAHPRLIMTPEKVSELRAAWNNPERDEVYHIIFRNLSYFADQYLSTPPSPYEIRDGIRLLYVCQENTDRITILAMMYLLTEEDKYAEAAYEAMRVCAEFKDWNPYHFLDVGTLCHALGIGYDWLYHWMTEEQRQVIRRGILEKGFAPYMEDLDNLPRKRSWNWRDGTGDNWCMIIAGECVAGLAICDELEGYDLECAERAMQYSLIDMGHSLRLFAPYGAYEEGPGYWGYAMMFYVLTIQSVITATGTDFGYVDVPGMKMTNQFMIAINGSVAQFNYHDVGHRPVYYPSQTMFLADYFGQDSQGQLRIQELLAQKSVPFSFTDHAGMNVLADVFLYQPRFLSAKTDNSQLNAYLPISEIAVFRTGFNRQDTYAGLHCDDPIGGDSHDHMDVGSFVLHSQGENFFMDLGADNYNISNYYKAYRMRAEGHNTVVFNPGPGWDQKYGGSASIVRFESNDHGGFAIGNLTNSYYEEVGLSSFRRGLKLDAVQDVVLLQD